VLRIESVKFSIRRQRPWQVKAPPFLEKMEPKSHHPHPPVGRFDLAVYEAAARNELETAPLLATLESARTLASGVVSILEVVRDHGLADDGQLGTRAINPVQAEDVIALCIESMSMLYTKIDNLADQLAIRHARTGP